MCTGAPASAASYTVLCATNVALPLSQWAPVGKISETAPGQYQFTDTGATCQATRFYILRWQQ